MTMSRQQQSTSEISLQATILHGLITLNLANSFGKSSEELAAITQILAHDLEGESPTVVQMALEYIRKNCRYWPRVAEILAACDTVRTCPDSMQALPPANDHRTPGIGYLYRKFKRERRSSGEFDLAAKKWQQYMADHKTVAAQIPAVLDALFGTPSVNGEPEKELGIQVNDIVSCAQS